MIHTGKNLFNPSKYQSGLERIGLTMEIIDDTIHIYGTVASNSHYPSFSFYGGGNSYSYDWWANSGAYVKSSEGFFNENGEELYMTIYIDGTVSSGSNLQKICFGFSDGEIWQYNTPSLPYTHYVPIKKKLNYINFGIGPSVTEDVRIRIQIEKGSTHSDYIPYYLPDVYAVKDGEPKRLYSVYRKSGNLYSLDNLISKGPKITITSQNSYITSNVDGSWQGAMQVRCKVDPNTDYAFSYEASGIDYRRSIVSQIKGVQTQSSLVVNQYYDWRNNSKFNSGDNTEVDVMLYAIGNGWTGTVGDIDIYDIRLEKGTTTPAFRPYLEKIHSIVPDGYQALEYIESTGYSSDRKYFIDSGYIMSTNYKVEISYETTKKVAGAYLGIVGGRIAEVAGRGFQLGYQGYAEDRVVVDNFNKRCAVDFYTNVGERYYMTVEPSVIHINGHSYALTMGTETSTGTSVGIFSSHNVADPNGHGGSIIAKLYYCKIYDNNILVRDFIPVKTTKATTDYDGNSVAVGTLGLYDKVSGKMFVNKGTGTFTAGPEL